MKIVWKKIKGSVCEISNTGKVRHAKTLRIYKNQKRINNSEYVIIHLYGKRTKLFIHKLLNNYFENGDSIDVHDKDLKINCDVHKSDIYFNDNNVEDYVKERTNTDIVIVDTEKNMDLIFTSLKKASKYLNLPRYKVISSAKSSKLFPVFGKYKIYIDWYETSITSTFSNITSTVIYVYDVINNIIQEFNTLTKAIYYTGIYDLRSHNLHNYVYIGFVISKNIEYKTFKTYITTVYNTNNIDKFSTLRQRDNYYKIMNKYKTKEK